MKQLLNFLFILLGYSAIICGQPSAPQAPSAAVNGYGKLAEIEPNLYNGALNIPISLATISEGPLSISYGLSYTTAGLRAYELASEIGLGWALTGGGVITKEIRGISDELEHGWMYTGSALQTGNLSNVLKNKIRDGDQDSASDIYRFQVNGMTGSFALDHDGNCIQIEQSDLRIELYDNMWSSTSGAIAKFKITDTAGTSYYFVQGEKTYADGSPSTEVCNTWVLKTIESFDQNHKIDLEYTASSYKYYSLVGCGDDDAGCDLDAQLWDVYTPIIDYVETSTGRIDFNYTGRLDQIQGSSIIYGPRRLESIIVSQAGQSTSYNLSHSYFEDKKRFSGLHYMLNTVSDHVSLSHITNITKRLKLDAINISSSDGSTTSPYILDYYKDQSPPYDYFFPNPLTASIDHWGYYNGESYSYGDDNNIPLTTVVGGGNSYTHGQAHISRESNFTEMLPGNLKSLQLPTGGRITYHYQANDFCDPTGYEVTTDQHQVFNSLSTIS